MGGVGEWRSWEMRDMWGAQEGFFFLLSFPFYINGVVCKFQFYTVVCSDNGKKKIFASYLTVASRAYLHFRVSDT